MEFLIIERIEISAEFCFLILLARSSPKYNRHTNLRAPVIIDPTDATTIHVLDAGHITVRRSHNRLKVFLIRSFWRQMSFELFVPFGVIEILHM